ncbi:DUF885 family protein [Chitinimonas sp. BJYL2]|uniref:DUF885 domain-containing protein n=1 Tax=Chitinimonas sp. BJYL2 TaxID=2976696 RepID=UPI0022B55224|nr:DUF885 domain-containing protein [Chitinimonas sp. BJYL2]
MFRLHAALFATVVLLAAGQLVPAHADAGKAPVATPATTPMSDLAERYFERWLAFNPLSATQSVGDARFDGVFVNNLSALHREQVKAWLGDTLRELDQIDPAGLSDAERLDHALLRDQVSLDLEGLAHRSDWLPINQMDATPITLVQLASTHQQQPFKTVSDYERFLTRLAGLPGWMDQAIVNMRAGMAAGVVQPRILMQRVLPQLRSQIVTDVRKSGFHVPIARMPAHFSKADRQRLTQAYRQLIQREIVPSFRRLHDFIEREYLPRCPTSAGIGAVPGGEAYYAYLVRLNTSTNLGPDAIHAIGLREVARIRAEIDALRQRVGFEGSYQAFLASLNTNPMFRPFRHESDVIAAHKAIRRKVEPKLALLFGRTPRSPLDIRAEPAITRDTAAAHYSIGTADGSRPGVFYDPVPRPREYTTPQMTALFLHEAMPGHHYQLSLQQELPLPRFRRYSEGNNAYVEGWALYAEGLGVEMGVYDDPYQYLGRLLMEMHRAIRLVVDTGMHAKGWSRERAIAYSLDNEGGPEQAIVPEIERYMAWPGQALGYKIGELKLLELRRRAEAQLDQRFDIKAFHDQILLDGAMPLAMLEARFEAWLARQPR